MEIYPHHFSSTLLLASLLLFLDVHLSGYGSTNYMAFLSPVEPFFRWLPGLNAYNIDNCDLAICGSQLTNIFHGLFGVMLLLLTSFFAASFLIAWYLFVSSSGYIVLALVWEYWELKTGVTICRPGDFPNVVFACAACTKIILDTVADIGYGFIWMLITGAFLVILDRHYSRIEDEVKEIV